MKKNIISLVVIGAIFVGLIVLGIVTSDKEEEVIDVEDSDTSSSNEVETGSEIEEEVELVIKEVSGTKAAELINGDELAVLFIMQTGCSYCEMFKPVINSVASEYDLDVSYVNITNMTETDDQTAFHGAHDFMQSQYGTPTTLIAKDGALYGILSGYVDKAALVSYFEKHGLID